MRGARTFLHVWMEAAERISKPRVDQCDRGGAVAPVGVGDRVEVAAEQDGNRVRLREPRPVELEDAGECDGLASTRWELHASFRSSPSRGAWSFAASPMAPSARAAAQRTSKTGSFRSSPSRGAWPFAASPMAPSASAAAWRTSERRCFRSSTRRGAWSFAASPMAPSA